MVVISGDDVIDGTVALRHRNWEERLDGSIKYSCQQTLILVAEWAFSLMSWVDMCICISKTSSEAESWDYERIKQIQD